MAKVNRSLLMELIIRGFLEALWLSHKIRKTQNIIGVVSGYRASVEAVFQQGQRTADLSVQSNTGLLVAFEIDYAIKAIQKNPIGYLLQ